MDSPDVPRSGSSPWREPVVWLVIALVGASVAGSLQLLRVAYRDGPVDSVADPVQRTGRAQQTDLGPDARAAALGLAAIIRIDRDDHLLEVLPVSGGFDRAAALELRLQHPLHAAEDQTVSLAPHGSGWRTTLAVSSAHDWRLQLLSGDGTWRLRGRLPRGQLATHLAPAIASNVEPVPEPARP